MGDSKENYGTTENKHEVEKNDEKGKGEVMEDYTSTSDADTDLYKESNWWTLLGSLRMEPGFLLYMIASVMGNIMASDLQIDRACRYNLGYNDTVCDGLMNSTLKRRYTAQETEVQKIISETGIWSEFVENFFPIIFSLFLGNWTDVYGIKLPLLLCIAGVGIRYIGLLLCVYFKTWSAQVVILFSILPGSLTGGRIAISMLVYSFVAVTSSIPDRTFRVGILTAVRTFGRSAGSALGGYLRRGGKDYYFIFGLGGGISIASFLYLLIFMPNPKKGSNPAGFQQTRRAAFLNLFNLKNIIEAMKAFFKKREYGVREQLYMLVIVLIFTMAPMQAEDSVLLLFVRQQLKWDTADYSIYSTFRMLIAFGGGILSVGIMVKMWKMADWKLGVISCISQIAGSLVYAFANNRTMMYIAPAVDILNGSMIIAARTMISKIVPIPEMGKINSFVAVIDSTTPMWANPLYNAIYRGTLETFTGAFFCVSAAFTIPPLVLFSYFGGTHKGIPIEEQAKRKQKGKAQPLPSALPNSPVITSSTTVHS